MVFDQSDPSTQLPRGAPGGETALDKSESVPHLSDNRDFTWRPLAAISARPIRTLHFKFRPIRMKQIAPQFCSLRCPHILLRSFFLDEHFLTGDYLRLYTDAAGGIGYGAICGPEWFYGVWPVECRCYNVAILELYPIMVAVHVWGSVWANQSMFLHRQRSPCFYH